jgi:hypothetical protein
LAPSAPPRDDDEKNLLCEKAAAGAKNAARVNVYKAMRQFMVYPQSNIDVSKASIESTCL